MILIIFKITPPLNLFVYLHLRKKSYLLVVTIRRSWIAYVGLTYPRAHPCTQLVYNKLNL